MLAGPDVDGQPDRDGEPVLIGQSGPERDAVGDRQPEPEPERDRDRDRGADANAQSGSHREPYGPSNGEPSATAAFDRGSIVAANAHDVCPADIGSNA